MVLHSDVTNFRSHCLVKLIIIEASSESVQQLVAKLRTCPALYNTLFTFVSILGSAGKHVIHMGVELVYFLC